MQRVLGAASIFQAYTGPARVSHDAQDNANGNGEYGNAKQGCNNMSLRDNKLTKIVCKSADVAETCGLFLVVFTRNAGIGALNLHTKLGLHVCHP